MKMYESEVIEGGDKILDSLLKTKISHLEKRIGSKVPTDNDTDTVDGSEIRRENHLGYIKPCK